MILFQQLPLKSDALMAAKKKRFGRRSFVLLSFIIYDRSQDSWFMRLLLTIVTDLFATAFIITKHNIQARYDRLWDKWMLGRKLNSKHDLKPKGPAFANMTKVSPQSIYKEYKPSKTSRGRDRFLGKRMLGRILNSKHDLAPTGLASANTMKVST